MSAPAPKKRAILGLPNGFLNFSKNMELSSSIVISSIIFSYQLFDSSITVYLQLIQYINNSPIFNIIHNLTYYEVS